METVSVRRSLLLALAMLSPMSAAAAVLPPPGNPNAPVRLVSFAAPPADIVCATGRVRLVEGVTPTPKSWQSWIPPVGSSSAASYKPPEPPTSQDYTFSVDADGRVTDLKSAGGTTFWVAEDQAATIVTWRFAPGAPASGCKIDLAPTHVPLAQAAPAQLFALLAAEGRNTPLPVRKALTAEGGCGPGSGRRPQTVVYPDLRAFDDKSIDPAWAGVRYDITANGDVRNVRIAAQHGEAAFADAAASAVAEARFFPGPARTGCFAAFRATPKATEAPARPKGETFERPQDSCKVTREQLNIPENKFYPPAYSKRRVSGWAIVRFDVAPWGQVGAVEVLAAQPSAAFGDAARGLVQSARPSPPASGYRGCIVPLVYAIPPVADEDY